jgi:hypothetical protein
VLWTAFTGSHGAILEAVLYVEVSASRNAITGPCLYLGVGKYHRAVVQYLAAYDLAPGVVGSLALSSLYYAHECYWTILL